MTNLMKMENLIKKSQSDIVLTNVMQSIAKLNDKITVSLNHSD